MCTFRRNSMMVPETHLLRLIEKHISFAFVDIFDHFEPSCVGRGSSRSEPLNTALVDRITERSMTFCSSRTLPGHECRTRAVMNSSEMPVIRLCMRAA